MNTASETLQGGHVFDLTIGETVAPTLSDRTEHRITLLDVHEPRCTVRGLIRFPSITVDIDGEQETVPAALYHLPRNLNGVKIDCPVTRGVAQTVARRLDVYALDKDARIRCWAPNDPLFGPTPIVYPARQAWFATMTQMANERTYVDGGEYPEQDPEGYIYHHFGMDIGGHDKAVPIVSARGGKVVVRGEDFIDAKHLVRYDRVVIRDDTGWYFLYSHLDMIAPNIQLGDCVDPGDPVGVLGKEGASGGWSHLHFGITAPQPSGRYGQVEGYAFLVEAYLNEHPGALLASARPHRAALVGESVELDGSRSICDGAEIASYEWTFQTGETADGVRATKTYDKEGMYSERLTVTDTRGQTDVDFCVVQVLPRGAAPERTPPAMHLTCYPTDNIRVGQPVAFKARTFFKGPFAVNNTGEEHWDFGDGATATSHSETPARSGSCTDLDFDERWHAYNTPGRYIVTVTRTGQNGLSATAQVKVHVE